MSNAIYSNARAKALTNNLLGFSRLKRMIESTPEEAVKILSEVNFGGGVNVSSPLEFEKILYAEERSLLEFIRTTAPNDYFRDYFLYPYDFHNAEALIKSKYLKIDPEKMLVCHGKIESSVMAEKIMTDSYSLFPKTLGNALLECDSLFVSGNATGEIVGTLIKKALYEELFSLSKKDKLLSDIFSFKVDSINVSVALRSRSFEVCKKNFLTGGNVSLSEIKSLCEESPEIIKEKIKFYKNGDIIKTAIDSFEKQMPLSEFEKIIDGYALHLLKKEKYSTEGIIPFMLYCYYKKSEINNVRIIMVGLINGLDKAQIEGRLRETYEG